MSRPLGNPRRSRPELGTGVDPRRGARACLATVSRSPTGALTSPSWLPTSIRFVRRMPVAPATKQVPCHRRSENAPWRPMGADVASLGIPAGMGMLHPVLGEALTIIEVAVTLTIIGTALFGNSALSERAFRLLRWLGNRPEPWGPASHRLRSGKLRMGPRCYSSRPRPPASPPANRWFFAGTVGGPL